MESLTLAGRGTKAVHAQTQRGVIGIQGQAGTRNDLLLTGGEFIDPGSSRRGRLDVYLAILLDFLARRVVGYTLSQRIDTALCLEALRTALAQRKPPAGVIHHSDRGVQYASGDYVDVLNQHGFRISMAHKRNPYANAAAESFIKTLKSEEVYLWEYRTLNEVQNRLPYFLEEVYNHKRLHSSIGYVPPVEFEELFYQTKSCPVTLIASI
jgi:transposase InsO family protein